MIVRLSKLSVSLFLSFIITGFWNPANAGTTAIASCGANLEVLNPNILSAEGKAFVDGMRGKIVGQDEAIFALADMLQAFRAGLNAPGQPVGNLLFLGPTGTGKTRVVEAAAELLFGDPRSIIKIDAAEFQHSHEIAKLIGSPPGYLGHRETHPLITQEALAATHTDKLKLSFLLVDEIEKASDALWQLLLGVLDKATLTLGDNRRVDLSQTMIFLTSNVGGAEIGQLLSGIGGFGFNPPTANKSKAGAIGAGALGRTFSPEFRNRLHRVVVFNPLEKEQIAQILDIELGNFQKRINDKFVLHVTPALEQKLLADGYNLEYGARHLKRALERLIVTKVARLLSTNQINQGDVILADYDGQDVTFKRESRGMILAVEKAPPTQSVAAVPPPTEGKPVVNTANAMAASVPIPEEPKK